MHYDCKGITMYDDEIRPEDMSLGVPCTFPGCNCFYHEDMKRPPGPGGIPGLTGWIATAVTPEAEGAIPTHDHRTMYEQGHYLPGHDGTPLVINLDPDAPAKEYDGPATSHHGEDGTYGPGPHEARYGPKADGSLGPLSPNQPFFI